MIKAVQLDLARQKETIEEVCHICDLAASAGFNTLVFYLEDRVKTASYQLNPDEESYSEAEIKMMVSYAADKNIEVIPVVSNLGHMERFFRHNSLQKLSENRDNIGGRFHDKYMGVSREACVSLPECYSFTDTYLKEVAELFPSKYFHVGLDEVWDVGFCSLCKERMQQEGLTSLFVSHILHTHKLLKTLNKTMMMWDDMLEVCEDMLDEIPKDIVLCSWNYGDVYRHHHGHFNNDLQQDICMKYEHSGFSYLIASCIDAWNVEGYAKYAKNHCPLGYLATMWEKSEETLLGLYPLVAYAGMTWNGVEEENPQGRLEQAVKLVYDIADEELARVIALILLRKPYKKYNHYFSALHKTDANEEREVVQGQYLMERLDALRDGMKADVYHAVRFLLERQCSQHEIGEMAQKLFDYRTGVFPYDMKKLKQETAKCLQELCRQKQEQKRLWETYRAGISQKSMEAYFSKLTDVLGEISRLSELSTFGEIGRLDVGLFMPDPTVAPKVRISVQFEDKTFVEIPPQSYKYLRSDSAYDTYSFPIEENKTVSSCQIDAWGYGAIGVTYVEASNRTGTYIPKGILAAQGKVSNVQNALVHDSAWCYMGEEKVLYGFTYPDAVRAENSIVIELKKGEKCEN